MIAPIARHGAARPLRPRALGRVALLLLIALLIVPRTGMAAEPLMGIAKNTLLGGATGLILGGTLTLVVDEEDRSEVVRWGVVIGTFGGFALGVLLAMRGEEDLFAAEAQTESQLTSASLLDSRLGRGAGSHPAPLGVAGVIPAGDGVRDRGPLLSAPLPAGLGDASSSLALRLPLVQFRW